MSLVVVCKDCVHPTHPRQVVMWRQNCEHCCTDFVSKHLTENPGHRLEVSGHISTTPFGDTPKQIRQLFGRTG